MRKDILINKFIFSIKAYDGKETRFEFMEASCLRDNRESKLISVFACSKKFSVRKTNKL